MSVPTDGVLRGSTGPLPDAVVNPSAHAAGLVRHHGKKAVRAAVFRGSAAAWSWVGMIMLQSGPVHVLSAGFLYATMSKPARRKSSSNVNARRTRRLRIVTNEMQSTSESPSNV